MSANMEKMIAHWAYSNETANKSAIYVLNALFSDPFGAEDLIVALKGIKAREGNDEKFQKLADAVWAALPKAIMETKDAYDAAFYAALAAHKS